MFISGLCCRIASNLLAPALVTSSRYLCSLLRGLRPIGATIRESHLVHWPMACLHMLSMNVWILLLRMSILVVIHVPMASWIWTLSQTCSRTRAHHGRQVLAQLCRQLDLVCTRHRLRVLRCGRVVGSSIVASTRVGDGIRLHFRSVGIREGRKRSSWGRGESGVLYSG